ncbi:MATE family efflux transporter [Natronincola ferrireducens]|uniref:Probable multidrug resistance protein NorM n=1 Tax=Natronincola ferrireducens TaxID=393762 RepID=A0A1G9A815_9FIRM|nr:MATE family efflux transporter [Natronincola ferrireducens]SDK23479.1 putative efflux protein, MATE family [Natronincola ferrireducens]
MNKKSFNRYLFSLTLPIVLQNLITTGLNLLDTFMIGLVGETELAAVGIANQFYFLFSLFIFGIAGGTGVLIAQLWGGQDKQSIKKVLGRSLITATLLTGVFILLGSSFTEQIIKLFNKDLDIVSNGVQYLNITLWGYFFTSVSFVLASALRSINNTKIPMYGSLFGLVINGALNYILIFGRLGFSPMFVQGAALATLIARILECLILVYFIYRFVPELALSFNDFTGMQKNMKKALKKVTYPVLFNEACWGIGMVTYVGLYARLGTQAAASMQICSTIMNLFMVVAFGLAYSALVVVGNEVGAGNLDRAMEVSRKIRTMAVKVSVFLSILLFVIAGPVAMIFNVSLTVKNMVISILKIYSLMLPLRMMNMIMIVGVHRGGGDALYSTVLQGSAMWVVGIPLTFLMGYVFKMPFPLVVGTVFVEEVVKGILIQKRYRSNKWMRVVFA